MMPEGSSVGMSSAPSQEYLGGRLVVGTPYSLVSAVEASAVAVSDRAAVAMMSPCRLVSCSTGMRLLLLSVAARPPPMPGMLRVPSVLEHVHAGLEPGLVGPPHSATAGSARG